MALANWALPQLNRLLPLDAESLKEIIAYTESLSKPAAAEHLQNILGDSPQSLEFISSFNNRRPNPQPAKPAPSSSTPSSSQSEVPRTTRRPAKAKKPIHELPARQIDRSDVSGAYVKKDEDDYMSARTKARKEPPLANTLALQEKPDALQLPTAAGSTSRQTPKLPPSATGALISDISSAKSSRASSPVPRSSTPSNASKTKIAIAGGTSMRGASTVLNDLDSAIRSLELSTNPSLSALTPAENAARRCDCMAQRHPLLAAAPNCISCGKIVCAKEGLGPCTFCERPLLSADETQAMLRILKDERGHARQAAHNASHTRAEIATAARPFSGSSNLSTPGASTPASSSRPSSSHTDDEAATATAQLISAKAHRDRLLAFQSQNARRTRIHDEAADFETPDAGTSQWASASERALQLKRQQKVLREQEWSAKPEWERKRMVVSLEIKNGRAVKTVRRVEDAAARAAAVGMGREGEGEGDEDEEDEADEIGAEAQGAARDGRGRGTFSRNPLLGSLIRPVYKSAEAGAGVEVQKGKGPVSGEGKLLWTQTTGWRRVQDDSTDNEAMILDGGAYGAGAANIRERVLGSEERAVGVGA